MIESDFADAINADPDDRDMQLIYADWLDDQGDPRGEAWRVLVEAGKFPVGCGDGFEWFRGTTDHDYLLDLPIIEPSPPRWGHDWYWAVFDDFFAAMDAAAIGWVRHHRPELASLVGSGM